MPAIRDIVFDLDGTLYVSFPFAATAGKPAQDGNPFHPIPRRLRGVTAPACSGGNIRHQACLRTERGAAAD